MPIYEFECRKCDQKFERLILSADDKTPECPECHGRDVQKIMSAGCKVALKVPGGYGGASAHSCKPSG
ncbi:MAG: transcriptional regulator [Desulfobacterales bacterium CG23_combo_of_CG06-09_8_20_14_all_51_8]|nr:MAG: transcriptional regulator [Desulfobacterales bacterium CG23_combo_of_CG06-09_8_20_14_all_51_8]